MLLGREIERAELERLLVGARAGRSAALVIRGEPGIGKSALLDYACERAEAMTVLRARGLESEMELAFSGLADLLRPVVGKLGEIPEPQVAALAGALAIGPPAPGSRFAVAAGTLSLLAEAAVSGGLLAAVDDLPWLDAPSREALLFVARRVLSEGVALLLVVREGEGPALDCTGIDALALGGLDEKASSEFLTHLLGKPVPGAVAKRVHGATGGNPLALREAAALLRRSPGHFELPEPAPPPEIIRRFFSHRINSLSRPARRALLIAATSDEGDMNAISEAARELEVDFRALQEAETAGLVKVEDGWIEFSHPLLRAAAYHGSSAEERRAAHRTLANVLRDERSADRRAWHLAAGALTPGAEIASELEQAALRARQRGGFGTAGRTFERASRLATSVDARVRFLTEAASDWNLAGNPKEALARLDEALLATADPLRRADIQFLRAHVETWRGRPGVVHALLVDEAARVESLDQQRTAAMLAYAARQAAHALDARQGVATGERAVALAGRLEGPVEVAAKTALGYALILRGDAPAGTPLLLGCYDALIENVGVAPPLLLLTPIMIYPLYLVFAEEFDRAQALLDRMQTAAYWAGSPPARVFALWAQSELDFRHGRWLAARAHSLEALAMARETGQAVWILPFISRLEAAQGREPRARAHADEALELASEIGGNDTVTLFAESALGLLELGTGRSDAAFEHLGRVARLTEANRVGDASLTSWAPDRIEALARAGHSDASAALARLRNEAERSQLQRTLAAADRCAGLLADQDEFEASFAQALRLHDRTPDPFERARTQLLFGERLRRAKRKTEAREQLRAALDTFDQLGAAPWADQARRELHASGQTLHRRRDAVGLDQLTPQELQVALIVARGTTNREAAARLFLSPRTIENHLHRVFTKLGVRSRTELSHVLTSAGAFGLLDARTPPETAQRTPLGTAGQR